MSTPLFDRQARTVAEKIEYAERMVRQKAKMCSMTTGYHTSALGCSYVAVLSGVTVRGDVFTMNNSQHESITKCYDDMIDFLERLPNP